MRALPPSRARRRRPRPSVAVDWGWDGVNGNNAAWVGTSAAGVRLFLKGDEDEWQAAVPYDSTATPSIDALNWNNGGKGGVRLHQNGSLVAFTGARVMAAGEEQTLRLSLLFTPVRPLDLPKHYAERYAQLGGPANYTYLAAQGATVVNMHQGNPINPWINYPYETNSLMAQAADACHAVGLRYKVYNTMRELTNRCRELHAMRALNETFVGRGPGLATRAADWLRSTWWWLRGGVVQPCGRRDQTGRPWVPTLRPPAVRVRRGHQGQRALRWSNYYVRA